MDYKNVVTLDIECYKNYLLVMFRKVIGGDVIYFEKFNDSELNIKNILHILHKYTIVTFNGIKYDMCILEAAVAGFSNASLKKINDSIIPSDEDKNDGKKGLQPWQVRKQFGITALKVDHIDIMEVAPLQATLKIYGGRIHCPKMQDLPIEPSATIEEHQLPNMRKYCANDNEVTSLLIKHLDKEIGLRIAMGDEYNLAIGDKYTIDLRSKSDAQIAEAVIKCELESCYGITPKKPKISSGTEYYFDCPDNIVFQGELLNDVKRQYTSLPFVVSSTGHVEFNFEITEADAYKSGKRKGQLPDSKKKLQLTIGNTKYTVGTGGLHSCEKSTRHTNENKILREWDAATFYPRIILNNKLYPKHIGEPFLHIYESIVNRRLKAKREGNKVVNESLKITINGSFGKFGSRYSFMYSPDLMMQVTITGQLTLLMLIERLELAGVSVVSANTDGIVVKMDPSKEDIANNIVSDWEFETDYEMEAGEYASLNSRDVNNYIAITTDGKFKGKGAYSDKREHFYSLRSNPANDICTEAVKLFLRDGIPIEETVRQCKDISKFVTVRTVNGGAIYDTKLIGKAIRWYYGRHELDVIRYNTNGNKVPRSDGAVTLMDLPKTFPEDMDYDWYVTESMDILKKIGYK